MNCSHRGPFDLWLILFHFTGDLCSSSEWAKGYLMVFRTDQVRSSLRPKRPLTSPSDSWLFYLALDLFSNKKKRKKISVFDDECQHFSSRLKKKLQSFAVCVAEQLGPKSLFRVFLTGSDGQCFSLRFSTVRDARSSRSKPRADNEWIRRTASVTQHLEDGKDKAAFEKTEMNPNDKQ